MVKKILGKIDVRTRWCANTERNIFETFSKHLFQFLWYEHEWTTSIVAIETAHKQIKDRQYNDNNNQHLSSIDQIAQCT